MRAAAIACIVAAWASAAEAPVTLFDDLVEVAPGQARTLAVPALDRPARLACTFQVLRGTEGRLLLLPAESVEAWLQGMPYDELGATAFGRAGTLSHLAQSGQELVLLVQARSGSAPVTRLRLLVRRLDPAGPFPPPRLPADRRRGEALVWGSLGLFAAVVAGGALRLRRLLAGRL